jgi:hypothetical protein
MTPQTCISNQHQVHPQFTHFNRTNLMIDLPLASTALGIICTLVWIGWNLSQHLNAIHIAIAEIRILLQSNNSKMNDIETDIKDLGRRVNEIEHKI